MASLKDDEGVLASEALGDPPRAPSDRRAVGNVEGPKRNGATLLGTGAPDPRPSSPSPLPPAEEAPPEREDDVEPQAAARTAEPEIDDSPRGRRTMREEDSYLPDVGPRDPSRAHERRRRRRGSGVTWNYWAHSAMWFAAGIVLTLGFTLALGRFDAPAPATNATAQPPAPVAPVPSQIAASGPATADVAPAGTGPQPIATQPVATQPAPQNTNHPPPRATTASAALSPPPPVTISPPPPSPPPPAPTSKSKWDPEQVR